MKRVPIVWSAIALVGCATAPIGCTTAVGLAADEDASPPPAPFEPSREGAATCQERCSADLHSRVCGDVTIETCAPDQGCGKGGCVPACDSASDNQSSTGCEYFALRLPTRHSPGVFDGDCFAVVVVNTWTTPVALSVERQGKIYEASSGFARIPRGEGMELAYDPLPDGKLPPGEAAVLFLSHNVNGGSRALCPVAPVVATEDIESDVRGEAFRIRASAPVVAYDFLPWGAGFAQQLSASLLLPSSAWGFEYLAVDGYRHYGTSAQLPVRPGDGITAIVARENDTEVVFRPSAVVQNVEGVDVAAGVTTSFTLQRGQYLRIRATGEPLAGSLIRANKPIGVWGGSDGLTVDEWSLCHEDVEAAHQELPPIRMMGNEYAAVRFRNRFDGVEESPPWRIVGAVPGTHLTYVPSAPPGAPSSVGTGDVIDFRSPGGFVVKSQDEAHPFYMAAYMESSPAFSCSTSRRGGPEFVNVIATAQYLTSYRFFTDPALSETNLVVVRKRNDGAFHDVMLDCAGALAGWTPIAAFGHDAEYEYTRVDLSRGAFEPQGRCQNGAHEMHSEAPFGVTVWGWATEAVLDAPVPNPSMPPYSYGVSSAFAAGMGARTLNVATALPVVK